MFVSSLLPAELLEDGSGAWPVVLAGGVAKAICCGTAGGPLAFASPALPVLEPVSGGDACCCWFCVCEAGAAVVGQSVCSGAWLC